jgi:hypothetical protein
MDFISFLAWMRLLTTRVSACCTHNTVNATEEDSNMPKKTASPSEDPSLFDLERMRAITWKT